MRYLIADLSIDVNLEYEYAIRRMRDYKSEFGGTHIRINIERDNNIVLPEYERFLPYQFRFNWLEFADGSFGAYRTLINSDYIIFFARWNKDATEVTIKMADVSHLKGGVSMDIREFSYLGEILQIILPYHNRLILHSSAIMLDGQGFAFTAPSGTGKSTHTEAWRKLYKNCVAINDDTPVVYNNGKGFYLYGCPWSGKTEINANICAPLSAIVCLEQGKENIIEKISPRQSFPFIWNELRCTPFAEREDAKLSVLSDILTTTDVYRLSCLPNDEAVTVCKDKIWKGAMNND